MGFDDIRRRLVSKVSSFVSDAKEEKLTDPAEQTNAEQELISYLKNKIEECRIGTSRVIAEGVWLTNTAYLIGFDNVFYDTSIRAFRATDYQGSFMRRNRVSINYVLPTIQNRLARLMKSPPRYDVKPSSTDEEDKEAARLGQYVINQIWEQQRINSKRSELLMWVQQCGHAYLKTCWDPTGGPRTPMEDPETGEVYYQNLGDVRIDVCSAFEVFPDPMAMTLDEANYVFQAKIRPIHYFRERFPERGHLVKPEDVWLTSLEYQHRINTFNSSTGGTGTSSLARNSAIEINYYEKSSKYHPNGRHVVIAGGVLLKDTDLPIDEIPFTKFDDVKVAGKYFSESVITHMRPIQDQLNRVISLRAAWANRMLMGKYIAARGHGLINEGLNDQSGEVVEYDPVPNAAPPTAMVTPPIPQYAYTEDENLMQKMNDIAGINEVSRGQLPSASIPAIGMQFLVEQDDTRIGVMTEDHEFGYAAVGRQILKYVENYYKEPRILKMAGSGLEYAVKDFIGTDIRGNHDVVVIRNSTLPGSKVLRRQEIINLHQSGYLGNPTDPKVLEKVLSMLEYGEVNEAWKDQSLDMGMIKRDIEKIEEEIMPSVSEFDNHSLYIQELNRYRKSEKFNKLSDISKTQLLQCMEMHLQEMTNIVAPDTADEGAGDPSLKESNAAQMMEDKLKSQIGDHEMISQEIPEMPLDIQEPV